MGDGVGGGNYDSQLPLSPGPSQHFLLAGKNVEKTGEPGELGDWTRLMVSTYDLDYMEWHAQFAKYCMITYLLSIRDRVSH